MSPATPEPQPSVGDVAALVHQIEMTEVDDTSTRFAKELHHSDSDDEEETASSVLGDVLPTTVNNAFEHECLEEAVALLGATSWPDAPDNLIRGTKYLLKPLPSVSFLAH